MSHRSTLAFGLAALLTLSLAGAATAAPIISNLPGNDGDFTYINAPSGGADGGGNFSSKAAGFTMPGDDDFSLDAVLLRLEFFNLLSVPVVELYDTGLGGGPGASLVAFANPAFAVGIATYTFTPLAPFTLAANATYWVVVSNAAEVANSFRWMTNDPGLAPTGIASDAGYRFDFGAPPPDSTSTYFNSYEVQGTRVAVPAPTAAALLGLGLALVMGRRVARPRRG